MCVYFSVNEEHEEALKDLNYEDLARAIPQFYQNVKITSFAHGNVTRETANQYVDVLCKGLSVTTCELPFPLTSCNLRQENNSHVIYGTKTRNPDEVNSAVTKLQKKSYLFFLFQKSLKVGVLILFGSRRFRVAPI